MTGYLAKITDRENREIKIPQNLPKKLLAKFAKINPAIFQKTVFHEFRKLKHPSNDIQFHRGSKCRIFSKTKLTEYSIKKEHLFETAPSFGMLLLDYVNLPFFFRFFPAINHCKF